MREVQNLPVPRLVVQGGPPAENEKVPVVAAQVGERVRRVAYSAARAEVRAGPWH
jgi:hypothetical protein